MVYCLSMATRWCGARFEQRYSVAQQRELHTRRRHPAGCGAEAECPEGGRGGFTQRSLDTRRTVQKVDNAASGGQEGSRGGVGRLLVCRQESWT